MDSDQSLYRKWRQRAMDRHRARARLRTVTYRDRRQWTAVHPAPRQARSHPHPTSNHINLTYITKHLKRGWASSGRVGLLHFGSFTPGDACQSGAEKRNPFRHYYLQGAYESQLSNKYIRTLNTSRLYKGSLYTFIVIFTRGAQPGSHERP